MHNEDNINSILNAINEINLKPKRKTTNITTKEKIIPKLNQDLTISPDIDRLILEAEKYQKKRLITSDNNTDIQNQKKKELNKDALILTNEVKENFNIYSDSIEMLNKKIFDLNKKETTLRNKIIDLENDKNILKANNKINWQKNYEYIKISTAEKLKSIYKQVEEQKKLFIDFKDCSDKAERDSNVYKENYERLVIENNDLKTRLKISKEQIVNYEANKKNLLSALNQLNDILSKSNIVGKISPQNTSLKKSEIKKITKIVPTE